VTAAAVPPQLKENELSMLRRFCRLLLAVLASIFPGLCFATGALADNLLVNGGFEDGTAYINQSAGLTATVAGWTYATDPNWSGFWNGAETEWGGGATLRTGARSLRVFHYGSTLGYPDGWRTSDAWQVVRVAPSQDYTASAWVFIYLAPGEEIGQQFRAGLRIEELDSQGATIASRQSRFNSASTQWRQVKISFRTTSETTHVRFVLTNHWLLHESLNHITYDDCALEGPSLPSARIPDILGLPDGAAVRLDATRVVSARFDGFFYLQEPGWCGGIRVNGDAFPGDLLEVSGQMTTVDGERAIVPSVLSLNGSAPRARPLGVSNGDCFRSMFPPGLLVTLTGRAVTAGADGAFFELDDGSGQKILATGATTPGEFLQVTGILTRDAQGSLLLRTTLMRRTDEPPVTPRQSFRAAFVLDDQLKSAANAGGQNYWGSYISEIVSRLGLAAVQVSPAELPSRLRDFSILFLAEAEEGSLVNIHGADIVSQLEAWVRDGGMLVGSRTRHLDAVMGNLPAGADIPSAGDFAVSSEFTLNESAFTASLRSPLHPDAPLVTIGSVRPVTASLSQPLAASGDAAVITAHKNGAGWGFYFGFDLGHTFWAIQQGRPVDRDYDGDGWLRTGDAQILGSREPEVPYTDALLFLLQNAVSVQPHPLVSYLPPSGSGIPDIMLFYGGDDENTAGVQVPAATFMGSRGLPYQINAMPSSGSFAVTPDELAVIQAAGTEMSLHYDFITGFAQGDGFTQADVNLQSGWFESFFGYQAVCSVNHWVRWAGWHEPALWMMMAGLKGDNSRFPVPLVSANPVNCIGFAFGTALPYHFWTDAAGGNQRIAFVEAPISGYELGYAGSGLDERQVRRALYLAEHYGYIYEFFYHPVYIASSAGCRAAIDKLLELIDSRGLDVIHTTPGGVVNWWTERSAIALEDVEVSAGTLSFTARNPGSRSFVVNIPVEDFTVGAVPYPHEFREMFGRRWLMMVLPPGDTNVALSIGP